MKEMVLEGKEGEPWITPHGWESVVRTLQVKWKLPNKEVGNINICSLWVMNTDYIILFPALLHLRNNY